MELHRYISFESFVDVVQSKSLCFVYPPVEWEDTYEGFVYRAMQTPLGREKIRQILLKRGVHYPPELAMDDKLQSITRYQCWSQARDKIVLWSLYSYSSKAIMISTTSEKIEKLTVDGRNFVKCMPVKYVESNSLEDELEAFTPTSFTSNLFFRTKRNEYEHENEIRAYIGTAGIIDMRTPLRVKIPDVHSFIDSVLVHPSAPSWYVDVVKEYCRINGINFLGQSRLFKFEV